MSRAADVATTDDHFALGLLATSYALGCRGAELELCLAGCTEETAQRRMHGALTALQSSDQQVRAKALAAGLALVGEGLRQLEWSA